MTTLLTKAELVGLQAKETYLFEEALEAFRVRPDGFNWATMEQAMLAYQDAKVNWKMAYDEKGDETGKYRHAG